MINYASTSQQYPTVSYSQAEALWVEAGGPSALAPIMAAIASAESSLGHNPISPTGDYGIWQINHDAHPQFDTQQLLSNPLYNAWAAVQVWKSQGLGAWTTYSSGAYLPYLAAATSGGSTSAGSSAFGNLSTGEGWGALSGSTTPAKPVAHDWSPAAKLLGVTVGVLLLFFAAASVSKNTPASGRSNESAREESA